MASHTCYLVITQKIPLEKSAVTGLKAFAFPLQIWHLPAERNPWCYMRTYE